MDAPINPRYCIMVVDDKPDTRALLQEAFRLAGHCVSTAATAGETITLLNAKCEEGDSCFDLIIMDIDLADVRGTTLGTWIRGRYPNVVIEYLTAFPAPLFYETAKAQGAHVTTKPLLDVMGFVAEMVTKIEVSVIPGDRRQRGGVNHSGQKRRLTDGRLTVSKPMEDHITAIAQERALAQGTK